MNNEAQEPLEIESSAILDPVGSNQFWSCPTAMVVVKVVPYPLPSCFNSYFSSSVLCHYGVSTALSHNKDVNLASICNSAYHWVGRQEWIKDGKLDERREKRERKEREGGKEGEGVKDVWTQGTVINQQVMWVILTSSYGYQSYWSLRDSLSLLQV